MRVGDGRLWTWFIMMNVIYERFRRCECVYAEETASHLALFSTDGSRTTLRQLSSVESTVGT